MHLKSLTLKGFKSFADRTHMSFEPGLTVIVGPNGSGKSNISDAILWVLGEQSAKQLRGQAMEDVIFSGSSARKSVGVAEVTLVLDNADHLLPVDFSEVAITRRMYRSGESEYLINASPCRLMDIQDILHDTGLGKDTHSIISQGKLDAILQSRPEERRALIEEAAGILKHKRRRERALKKIGSMDVHLTRARDINREVKRQLKPLEKQVDRARKHRDLTDRAQQLTQILAVDELRRLQNAWNEMESRANEATTALELARYRANERAAELEKLQVMLEEKGLFVGDLSAHRRHMQDVVGRIDSDMRLLEEKGRNMLNRLSDARATLSRSEYERQKLIEEQETLLRQLDEVCGAVQASTDEVNAATPSAEALHERHLELDASLDELGRTQRECQRTIDEYSLELARIRESLAGVEQKDTMFATRLTQIDERTAQVEEELAARRDRVSALETELTDARERISSQQDEIARAKDQVALLRTEEEDARTQLASTRSELAGLCRLDESLSASSPLVKTIAHARELRISARLGDIIEVPSELEALVENLLAADIDAFVLDDAEALHAAAQFALSQRDVAGETLMLRRDSDEDTSPVPALSDNLTVALEASGGCRLLDRLRARAGYETVLERLLGHMVLVPDLETALSAPELAGVTYVCQEGARVHVSQVRLGKASNQAVGILERKRHIRKLTREEPVLQAKFEAASTALDEAEAALVAMRTEEEQLLGAVARLEGERSSALSEIGRLERELSHTSAERTQVSDQREAAMQQAAEQRPRIEELEDRRTQARITLEDLQDRYTAATDELEQVRAKDAHAALALADAKVRLAQTSERQRSLEARAPELKERITALDARIQATRASAQALEVLRLRVEPLHARYEALSAAALQWAGRLRDQATLEEADSASLKKTIEDAKASVNAAKDEVDAANDAVGELKVERGRLEVQVQSAISAITESGAMSLEEALALPAQDDPEAARLELEDLVHQINKLGPVNQVAFQEYERLRERADYVEAQLADLEAARGALTKITAAIDRKMRHAFLLTFDKVDAHFREVFSILFSGGAAHLEMTDPERPADTGIEVVAQPRGKKIAKMTLMSGGEKSLTALALLFAVYRTRTVPFYVLDEVEAALDDSNLSRLIAALDTLRHSTQLLVISHQRRTMEDADVLYGVSMRSDGVSRVVSQKIERSSGKVGVA